MLCARALPAAASSAKTTYAWELPRVAAMAPLSTAALRGIFFSRSTGTDRSRTDSILPYLRRHKAGKSEAHPAVTEQGPATADEPQTFWQVVHQAGFATWNRQCGGKPHAVLSAFKHSRGLPMALECGSRSAANALGKQVLHGLALHQHRQVAHEDGPLQALSLLLRCQPLRSAAHITAYSR